MYPYPPPEATPEDYLTQFQRLLPRGRVWHRGWGWIQDAHLLTLMPVWSRLQRRLNDLIAEIFPCTTTGMLPEWEATLGLPDNCVGPLATIQERQGAVCGKFASRGGQSIAYYTHLAASFGYQITVDQWSPFRVSIDTVGEPLYDEQWAFAWRIVVAEEAEITYFRVQESAVGEPLASWGNRLLECEIYRVAPAHTKEELIWAYQINQSLWDGGQSIWDAGESPWDQGMFQ